LATCPVESFGLAALEALACGTPVVSVEGGAVSELLARGAGAAVPATGAGLADGVQEVLARPVGARRAAARGRALEHPWQATIEGMLTVLAGGAVRSR
jgi:alpha-1,6-mannosyltransferase